MSLNKTPIEVIEQIAELNCPEAYGFEGANTFPYYGS